MVYIYHVIKYHMLYHTCQNALNFSVLTNFVQFNFERGSPQTVKKKNFFEKSRAVHSF